MRNLTPLQYIKKHLFPNVGSKDFMREWRELSDQDKKELKAWAEGEMAAQEKQPA